MSLCETMPRLRAHKKICFPATMHPPTQSSLPPQRASSITTHKIIKGDHGNRKNSSTTEREKRLFDGNSIDLYLFFEWYEDVGHAEGSFNLIKKEKLFCIITVSLNVLPMSEELYQGFFPQSKNMQS